jgi:hypothetical protein
MSEQSKNHLLAGIVSSAVLVLLLALMDVNFCGWLGVWFVRQMPYIAGIPLAILLGLGASYAYGASVARSDWGPPPVRGVIFGVIVAALFVWLMPWVFSELVGQATGVTHVGRSAGAFDVFPKTFDSHYEPLPDMGFDAPMKGLADKAWYNKDDWQGRLVPFGIAFAAMGLTLALVAGKKK